MLKADLDAELEIINAEVDVVLAKRKAWMDAHMGDYAKYQIGDVIYDLKTGEKLGCITRHYRYQASHAPFFDTTMSIEYEFETPLGCLDNTSRHHGWIMFGNIGQLLEYQKSELAFTQLKVKASAEYDGDIYAALLNAG